MKVVERDVSDYLRNPNSRMTARFSNNGANNTISWLPRVYVNIFRETFEKPSTALILFDRTHFATVGLKKCFRVKCAHREQKDVSWVIKTASLTIRLQSFCARSQDDSH